MKKQILVLLLIPNCLIGFSQQEITKQDSINIIKKADNIVLSLRKELSYYTDEYVDFASDTCRIETIEFEKMQIDYSTLGINVAVSESKYQYDKLLNKYYKKLAAKLEGSDKEILKQTQRNWIQFRNSEYTLKSLLSEEKYSGGGTMQSNFRNMFGKRLTKNRLIEIFHHYLGLLD
tara:strand:- start:193 stop:720 length:528 start_codon:yes stop_codon:yes gene_type:complete